MKKSTVKLNLILLLALALPLNTQAAAPVFNVQLTIANEDFGGNVEDSYNKITGSVRSMLGITRNSAFNLNADIYSRSYNDFDQWDSNGLLLEAIYSYIPAAGFRKPTYLLGLRHELEAFDDSSRDFNRTSLILGASFRLDDRTTMTPGIQYSQKSTDEEDDNIAALFLNTDLRLSNSWLSYLNIKYESEKISTDAAAVTTSPRIDIASHHTPAESGGMGTTLPASSTGSKLKTDSSNIILTLGANYSIDRHQTIDVSYQRQNYGIKDSPDVTGNVVSLDYFYKF